MGANFLDVFGSTTFGQLPEAKRNVKKRSFLLNTKLLEKKVSVSSIVTSTVNFFFFESIALARLCTYNDFGCSGRRHHMKKSFCRLSDKKPGFLLLDMQFT